MFAGTIFGNYSIDERIGIFLREGVHEGRFFSVTSTVFEVATLFSPDIVKPPTPIFGEDRRAV